MSDVVRRHLPKHARWFDRGIARRGYTLKRIYMPHRMRRWCPEVGYQVADHNGIVVFGLEGEMTLDDCVHFVFYGAPFVHETDALDQKAW
jgi:hypothetical protein